MAATKIMIVRHAERPEGGKGDPTGVTLEGLTDAESLIVQGWQRAGALATLFDPFDNDLRQGLAVPDVIFASDDHVHTGSDGKQQGSHSRRPKETVTPLAARLGLTIDTSCWLGNEAALVTAATASTGVVLIAWQHEAIPTIANLLVPPPTPIPADWPVPQHWPGKRYDVVWIFDPPSQAGGPWIFSQVPQNLLAGDKNTIIEPKAAK